MRKVYLYFISLLALAPCGQAQMSFYNNTPPGTLQNADWVERQQEEEARSALARPAERPTGANISVTRLKHRVPGKAQKAFDRGLKFAVAEEWQRALEQFQAAITIDPNYSEAHGNMGVELTALGRFEEAASAFRRALELDPATGVHHSNLAYALIRLDQEDKALAEAQTGVTLDPSNARSQFLLGYLLTRQPGMLTRSEQHLLFAAREVPEAHYMLAAVYLIEGAQQNAETEMERYRKATTNHKP